MWIGGDTPIELQRNAILPLGIQIYDDVADEPVDMTGYIVTCVVSLAAGEASIPNAATVVTDDIATAQYTITFNGDAFDAIGGDQEPVRLMYNVLAALDGEQPVVIMRGPLILLPGAGD